MGHLHEGQQLSKPQDTALKLGRKGCQGTARPEPSWEGTPGLTAVTTSTPGPCPFLPQLFDIWSDQEEHVRNLKVLNGVKECFKL